MAIIDLIVRNWKGAIARINRDNPFPVAQVARGEPTWVLLIDNVRIDDDPTAFNSDPVDTTRATGAWILVDIDSTLSPTDIRVLAQYSHDGGNTWWDFEEGLWASLFWEDTDTASGINKAFLLPCGGIDLIRIRLVGAGTDATNFFDVTVFARTFYGSVPVAHA